jgi:hypothetical protein
MSEMPRKAAQVTRPGDWVIVRAGEHRKRAAAPAGRHGRERVDRR